MPGTDPYACKDGCGCAVSTSRKLQPRRLAARGWRVAGRQAGISRCPQLFQTSSNMRTPSLRPLLPPSARRPAPDAASTPPLALQLHWSPVTVAPPPARPNLPRSQPSAPSAAPLRPFFHTPAHGRAWPCPPAVLHTSCTHALAHGREVPAQYTITRSNPN